MTGFLKAACCRRASGSSTQDSSSRATTPTPRRVRRPWHAVHRAVPAGPRRHRELRHAGQRRALDRRPDPRQALPRAGVLHRLQGQMALWRRWPSRHGCLRLQRLGGQRQGVLGPGRQRRRVRRADRAVSRPVDPRPRRVTSRGSCRSAGEPPRHHVVPDGPALVPGAERRDRSALKERYRATTGVATIRFRPSICPTSSGSPSCPHNFDDDLHTKPDVHRRFMHEMSRSNGWLDPDDHRTGSGSSTTT